MLEVINTIKELTERQESFVLVTLAAIKGSMPQELGAKMVVGKSGRIEGTVGGGKIEAHCIAKAQELLETKGETTLKTINLQRDIGMSCGGEGQFFFEVHRFDSFNVAIFGAGHISHEVCLLLVKINSQISVFDDRKFWIDALPRAFNLNALLTLDLSTCERELSENTVILCMTKGHTTDLPILTEILKSKKNYPFVGVIGSEVKARKLKAELRELQIDQKKIDSLCCPLGLPIGKNTPFEIAISIVAQVLAVRDKDTFYVSEGKVTRSGSADC